MNVVAQNLLVLAAVLGCGFFLTRSAYRALHGKKSGLTGCGVCGGCATTPQPKPQSQRIVMVPMDALRRSRQSRVLQDKNSSSQS